MIVHPRGDRPLEAGQDCANGTRKYCKFHFMHVDFETFTNPFFEKAVRAIEDGSIAALNKILANHPDLMNHQAYFPGAGYFERPYLLYFIADNPIRRNRLPENVLDILHLLIKHV